MPSHRTAFPGSAFWTVVRLSAREFTAYPSDVLLEFFTYPVAFLGYYFFLQAIAGVNPLPPDLPLQRLALYYSLGWLLRMIFHQRTDVGMGSLIAQGDIALLLLRPLDISRWMLAQALGQAAARALFYAGPGIIVLALFGGGLGDYLPANPLVFCLAAATGFLILFELQMFIGALSFFTTLNFQMSWTLDMLMRLLAGLVVPLSLLPEVLQSALAWLPFPHVFSIPIRSWIEPQPLAVWAPVLLQGGVWAALLHLLNRRFYGFALKRLDIFGG